LIVSFNHFHKEMSFVSLHIAMQMISTFPSTWLLAGFMFSKTLNSIQLLRKTSTIHNLYCVRISPEGENENVMERKAGNLYICKRSPGKKPDRAGCQPIHEIPTVLPSSHMTSENSIMKSAWSNSRSITKPYTSGPVVLQVRSLAKKRRGHLAVRSSSTCMATIKSNGIRSTGS
jgi:hypothetical protein